MAETGKPGVLIISPFFEPNVGGVETHLKDLTGYLKKDSRFRVFVVTYQPITTKAKGRYYEKDGGLTVIRIPWIGMNLFHRLEPYPVLEFLYITPWLFLWNFLFLLAKGKDVDVIHAQGFNAALIARLLAGVFGKRFVASTHAIYGMPPGSAMAKAVKWTLGGSDSVLTLSEASRRELIRIGLERKIETYTYWIEQDVFKPVERGEARKITGWGDRFVALFVGRLIEVKGTDILIEVARRMKGRVHFAFIGDGPLAGEIKKASDELENVLFIGKVDNKDLPAYYSAADILCVPSKYEEGFGRVILEALSCGTPVVASRRGGIPEAVDGTVGVLTEPTADDFERAISRLCEDRKRLESKASACRGYATERFGWANARKIVEAYSPAWAD